MTDFLDEKRKEIQARLKELKPLVDEYHRLEAAERALSGVTNSTAADAARRSTPRRAAAHHRRVATAAAAARAAAAPAPQQALELVRAQPRHHDPRARRGDGDQAELPVPRDARPGLHRVR